jgi:hypothetical protein
MSAKKLALTLVYLHLLATVASPVAIAQLSSISNGPAVAANIAVTATRAPTTMAMASRAARAPLLDGRDDDEIWRSAAAITGFRMFDPTEDGEPSMRTDARFAYTDHELYVFVRAFDPHPDSIISLLSRRDVKTTSDQIKLMIDSYHDRRTGYEFAVNPAGVKRDYYTYDDGQEDVSWDAVWDVATRIDSLGWTAEFRVPLSQLRYAPSPEHTFGVMIVRDIARLNERDAWPLLRRSRPGVASQFGDVGGFIGLASPRRVELTPYALTRNASTVRGDGFARSQQGTVGADLKYGLTSNLTLDATVNPDFGQVEADPAQLNLTAFETFFDERRPFFLEGAGIFTFNTNCGDIDSQCTGLFYSRRIGRNPQLADSYGDATSPTATPIAAAAKLTGRLANGFSIGLLDAVTQRVDGISSVGGQLAAIEPRTNYGVVRLQHDDADGQGDMGLMLTGVNRALDPGSAPFLRSAAYTGGIDLRRRFADSKYELRAFTAMSDVRGSTAAIAALQSNTVHAYQRPDDAVAYDPTRTALRGDAERITFSKFGGGITRFQTMYQRFSPGFESNDVGYQQRADEQKFSQWFALQFSKPTQYYQRANVNFNASERWTTDGLVLGNGLNTNFHIQARNFYWVHFGVNANQYLASYDDRDARGGPAIRRSPSLSYWSGIESDNRRAVTGSFWFGGWKGDEGRSWNAYANPNLAFRVSSRFSTALGFNYQRNADDKQYYASYGAVGSDTTHYTFARLDQTTFGLSTRLNFTATPNLSFQFYGEPFVSNGTFANWRELNAPRAERFEDRFKSYEGKSGLFDGFNYRQFRSNAVVRYEYRPGSTLFVVWQQGRSNSLAPNDEGYNGNYSFSRDYDTAFRDHPNNTFLVKWSYWLDP